MPAKSAKKPAAKKAVRRPPATRKPSVPTLAVELVSAPGRLGTDAQRRQFAALVATGTSLRAAYLAVKPGVSPCTADDMGGRWAADMAEEIARLRQTASHAAALAHGVDAAYLIGHAKAILETPLSQISAESIYCKKYKITETMTDAGPKTTIEVEKDAPLAAVQTMAKLTGLDGSQQAKQAEAGQEQATADPVRQLMLSLISPGSPISRALAARKAAQ